MVLQKKKSFDFRDTYNRHKKNTVFLEVSLYGLNNACGQVCVSVPAYTDNSPSNLSVCQVQMNPGGGVADLNLSYSAGKIIRINSGTLSGGGDENKYKFSTVGESTEDTDLYLYNSAGGQLAYNDDAPGTKQSAIIYHFRIPAGSAEFLMGACLVVAKKGCLSLTKPIRIEVNMTNLYDRSPEIIEPSPFCLCKGSSAKPGASVAGSATNEPILTSSNNIWTSSDTAIATTDVATGEITFKDEGTVEISLTNTAHSGCTATNSYVIKKPAKTLSIIHD